MPAAHHTPGPWTVAPNGHQLRVWDSDNVRGGVADICIRRSIDAAGKPSAAEEANAALISAAPDMLAALRECVEYLRDLDDAEPLECVEQARAAIVKATARPLSPA